MATDMTSTGNFDPTGASLVADPDTVALATHISGVTGGVSASRAMDAADHIVAAFKGGQDPESAVHQILWSSMPVMPFEVRKGIRRAYYQQVAGAKPNSPQPDPAQFWADNAKQILAGKFSGRGSWRAQAKNWLANIANHVQRTAGVRSDDPVYQSLTNLTAPGSQK